MESTKNIKFCILNLKASQVRGMESQVRKNFAEVIKEMRGVRSYRAFAKVLGVSHPTIKAWENLEGTPDQESLERVAALRGESLSDFKDFLGGLKKPTPFQKLVQQVRSIPDAELAVLLRAIADRIENY
jgi:transcriptional regulator with XRE-family HTH domain